MNGLTKAQRGQLALFQQQLVPKPDGNRSGSAGQQPPAEWGRVPRRPRRRRSNLSKVAGLWNELI